MGHVQDSPVSINMIPNKYMIYHMNYNLGQKKIQNPKFIFYFIMRHPGVCIFEKEKNCGYVLKVMQNDNIFKTMHLGKITYEHDTN